MRCKKGCCDCCYALFDLTLIEAMHLNRYFHQKLDADTKERILRRADEADREVHRIKHQAFKQRQKGVDSDTILQEVGQKRVRCPLLEDDNTCALYAHRPLTCRVYGLPMSVQGQVHTCGHTGFEPGREYPTIHMDTLQDRLMDITQRMVQAMPTKYDKLGEVLVPVSMALINEYDDEYLGIVARAETKPQKDMAEWTLGSDED